MSEPTKRSHLTLDQVMEIVSEIARNGDGAERFRALKMVHDLAQETGGQLLPPPTTEAEVMERGARLFTGLGEVRCAILMKKCFRRPMNRGMFDKSRQPKKNRPEPATDGLDAESS